MARQEDLRKILVVGARCTLLNHTVNGEPALNSLLNREQLIVSVDDEHGINLIISEPNSPGETLKRHWKWPDGRHFDVTKDGFTLTSGGGEAENPKYTWQYQVVPPEEKPAEETEVKGTQEGSHPATTEVVPTGSETPTQVQAAKEGGDVEVPVKDKDDAGKTSGKAKS